MNITPLDIRHKKFRRQVFGYDREEVNQFLGEVRVELENIVRSLREKEDEVTTLEKVLAEHREREAALKRTVVSAQRISEDIKKNSEQESKLLIEQAEMQAEKMLNQAHFRLRDIITQIQEVKKQKVEFVVELRAMLEKQQQMLALLEKENSEKGFEDIGILPKGQFK